VSGHGSAHSTGAKHAWWVALWILGIGALLIGSVAAAGAYGGYRINTTPSFPLGLWRIEPLSGQAAKGDTVFVCLPPDSPSIKPGLERGYLPRGLCPGGLAPLIKTIVATSGATVSLSGGQVFIDGVKLAHSAVVKKDGSGRPMVPYAGGQIPTGFVFLHSDFVASYDSRYFGPVPASGILGLARPVFIVAVN
jgi:conjugative transfer signal peptidase TraF